MESIQTSLSPEEPVSFVSIIQKTVQEAWAVIYAHGGIISEFSSEQEAKCEAEQWGGVCFRLNV
ncbi:hypothetical protein ACFQDN_13500 [Pseudomonas asuensis]|jgi:hypothetical protein|uniref:Uncharacterized protein n=1 Tax=Pseudomonas asuensis TaxID=1825787 RepID=A0ABQ2H366_9PSED|nr:hypothetical protein [Pseudomonas asuensis]GGM27344.1 hypothetical protein GCM10009425_42440 [Pseudomonas asuensis]